MRCKSVYQAPECLSLVYEMDGNLLGGSPVNTAMTITLIEFGEGSLEDGGDL